MSNGEYVFLAPGETLEIGDEYDKDGQWVALTEEEFEKWVSFRHYYDPELMPSFRRSVQKPLALAARSDELRDAAEHEATAMFRELIGVTKPVSTPTKRGAHPYEKGRARLPAQRKPKRGSVPPPMIRARPKVQQVTEEVRRETAPAQRTPEAPAGFLSKLINRVVFWK